MHVDPLENLQKMQAPEPCCQQAPLPVKCLYFRARWDYAEVYLGATFEQIGQIAIYAR
jgi:hypothetical protein